MNIGIKKAMSYNPKWIICSSDDMYKIDPLEELIDGLKQYNTDLIDAVFTQPSLLHSNHEKIAKRRLWVKLFYTVTNKGNYRTQCRLFKKFDVNFFMGKPNGINSAALKKGHEYLEIQDFGIYSANWVLRQNGRPYDETFINACEDTDVSIRFSLEPHRIGMINYKIGDYSGTSLGVGIDRAYRSIAGLVYLNHKWKSFLKKM